MDMQSFAKQMAFYQSYHQSKGCKFTHFFGVPLVTLSILIAMGWIEVRLMEHAITLAFVFVFSTLVYYFLLTPKIATLLTLIFIPVLMLSNWISHLPKIQSRSAFLFTFLLGIFLQLWGHKIEGKKPALLDNFLQAVFMAPIFILMEFLLSFGLIKPLIGKSEEMTAKKEIP